MTRAYAVLVTAAAMAVAAAWNAGAAVTIAEDGQARAVIVHNGHTAVAPDVSHRYVRNIKPAAEELQDYLKQITGAELELVATVDEAAGRPAIVLEMAEKVPGASEGPRGGQAYRLKTDGNRLTLTAASPMGLHYAVYGLLEDHLGCRFYTFTRKGLGYAGRGHEVVPQARSLTLDRIDDLQEPSFPNRGIIYWLGSYPWILQNRGIGAPADDASGALAAGHNFYHLLPPNDKKDKQGNVVEQGLFAEHPDFYPLKKDGERKPDWSMGLCGTNPDLPGFLARGIRDYIAKRTEQSRGKFSITAQPLSAAQGDGFTGCQCPDCRRLVHEQQSEAAPLILMLNRALDDLNQTHPELQLITFAYFETLDAPRTLKPHRNLWINVVSSARSQNMAGDQVGPLQNNPANRDYARAIREWPRIAPDRVTIWDWDTYRADWPSIFYLAENMRYAHECGIYGFNPQYCGGPWVDLLAWTYLKLAWDIDQDADALIRRFLHDNYGREAGDHVWDYLKLTQSGYDDSLHVPSAVRWSGWTPLLRQKLFPASLMARMTESMDKAMAAAEKAGDPELLANLIGARGQSLDVMTIEAAVHSGRPWGPVRYEGDGKNWFVAGADPRVPGCLMRAKKGIVMDGGGEHGILRSISGYVRSNGGPLVELGGAGMAASICPDLRGQITSAVLEDSGKELLAVQGAEAGYCDDFGRIHAQIWLPPDQAHDTARRSNSDWSSVWSDFENPDERSLDTVLLLSPAYYGYYPNQQLRRTVSLSEEGLKVERRFVQEKSSRGGMKDPTAFSTRWRLALPDPKTARVAIRGGGIMKALDLRYAVPGGIRGVQAGERLPGLDAMDERFDDVVAVSDAEVTRLEPSADADGELVVQLDRGDGVAAVLTTPAAGWDAVEVKPVVDQHYLEVRFIGKPEAMSPEPKELELPAQTLSTRSVPGVAATDPSDPSDRSAPTAGATVKLARTGETTAVNPIDGAELVWVPAGEFLRGSADGEGGGDERPRKSVYLDGYWIYRHPVTVGQYRKFCEAAGKEFKPTWGQGMRSEPVGDEDAYAVLGNWYEAEEYATWAGAALPTEAQWEKAARGTDGRDYPWGSEWAPGKCASMEETLYKFSIGFRPVGSYPEGASPCGALDMAGNVWEWVADWYDYEYYRSAPDRNPVGPQQGSHKVLRGGCSLYDERFSRTAARMVQPPHVRDWTATGFRCVVNGPGPESLQGK